MDPNNSREWCKSTYVLNSGHLSEIENKQTYESAAAATGPPLSAAKRQQIAAQLTGAPLSYRCCGSQSIVPESMGIEQKYLEVMCHPTTLPAVQTFSMHK